MLLQVLETPRVHKLKGKSDIVELENATYSFYVLHSSLEGEHDFLAMQLL